MFAADSRQIREQLIIFGVRSDKEPHDDITAARTDCPIGIRYSHAPNWQSAVERLKLQARMAGIRLETLVGVPCSPLNLARQVRVPAPKIWMQSRDHSRSGSSGSHSPRLSESNTCSTNCSSLSSLAAVDFIHRSSSSISCSTRRARDSCRSSGICRKRSMACSTIVLIKAL